MEAAKGFVFDRGQTELGHSYLVSFVLITDKPLTGLNRSETIIMGVNQLTNEITDAIEHFEKYVPPDTLGDASVAIIKVSHMNPQNLKKVKRKNK